MRIKTIGFIGLGLIGGSIAKAIKQYHPDIRILAYMRSRDTLEQAVREGTVDQACQAAGAEFSACDLIYLCAPVATNARYLETLKDLLAPSCLLTDVGSTKTDIHEKVQALGLTGRFIGGHPMAGSEKTGYENAKPHLIENAYYMLTPGEEVPQETVRAFTAFTASLKAIPMVVDYRQHDFITACVSHLPHLIASSLVELVRDLDSGTEVLRTQAGGLKDIRMGAAGRAAFVIRGQTVAVHENIERLLLSRLQKLGFCKAGQNARRVAEHAVGLFKIHRHSVFARIRFAGVFDRTRQRKARRRFVKLTEFDGKRRIGKTEAERIQHGVRLERFKPAVADKNILLVGVEIRRAEIRG